MTDAQTLGRALDELLQPERFKDYGPCLLYTSDAADE